MDQVAEAETAVGTYYISLQIVSFLSETVRGDVAKFRQYASMTAVPHSSQRRPGSANATRQHVNGLLGTPLKSCMGLRVLKISKYSWPRLVATKLRSNDERMNIERIEPPTQFRGPPRFHPYQTPIATSTLLRRPHQHGPFIRRPQSIMQTVSRADHRSAECWKNHHP